MYDKNETDLCNLKLWYTLKLLDSPLLNGFEMRGGGVLYGLYNSIHIGLYKPLNETISHTMISFILIKLTM